jgi:nitric oxide reductase NorD protein
MNDHGTSSPDPLPPDPSTVQQRVRQLAEALAEQLDPEEVDEALRRLHTTDASLRAMILGLGLLLTEQSAKAAGEYLRQAPLLIDRLGHDEWGPWVGVGLKIAARSSVAAVRYFRETPQLFAEIETLELRRLVFACADGCAEGDAGLALELLRQAPDVIRLLPPGLPADPADTRLESVRRWADCGMRLAAQDAILASEYFKQSAPFLLHLPAAALQVWAELGGTLVQPNQLGKPDYLPALEYFRVSPEWLGAVTPSELRAELLALVRSLTDEPPDRRVHLLKQAPQWLQSVPSATQRHWLLNLVRSLTDESPAAAIALLAQGGELIRRFLDRAPQAGLTTAGDGVEQEWRSRMEAWVAHGRRLLGRSAETGLAYFRLESLAAEQSLDHAAGGLSLRPVARTLTLFAEGLSGHAVTIHPIEADASGGSDDRRLPAQLPYREGRTIFLPPFVSEFGSAEENFRYFKVMTAYQAVQLECRAFEIDRDTLIALSRELCGDHCATRLSSELEEIEACKRSGLGRASTDTNGTEVERFFSPLGAPALGADLWNIAEGGRVDAFLRRAYPGLRGDLDLVTGYTLFLRPSLGLTDSAELAGAVSAGRHIPSTVEQVVELLLQLSMAGRTKEPIPPALEPLLYELGSRLQRVQRPDASAIDSLRAAYECGVVLLQRLTGPMELAAVPESASAVPSANPLGQAGAPLAQEASGDYRAIEPPHYRGRQGVRKGPSAAVPMSTAHAIPPAATPSSSPSARSMPPPAAAEPAGEGAPTTGSGGNDLEGAHDTGLSDAVGVVDQTARTVGGAGVFVYPEWDETIQDYRSGWCTIHERVMATAPPGGGTAASGEWFVDQALTVYRGQRLRLRNMFERLRPDRFKKLKRQETGEEIDLDAAIEAAIERRIGRTPSDKLYLRRDRRERDVAVALLVDVSGSTGQQVAHASGPSGPPGMLPPGSSGRSIIQVEKESVLLLAEAVEAVGDALAIYAYSGDGRGRVDFYLVKEFDEHYSRRVGERIGAMTALAQNRDGAAIRHATRKLLQREAATRLLLWLSDGRPFDGGYEGEHALADTKRALVEARRGRVRTFCITIDQRGEDYQAALFAPGRYAVIDDVRQLPERLSRIYQRVTT